MGKVTIFTESCKGMDDCGICRFVCPKDLFEACKEMNATGYYPPEIKDESECTGCDLCIPPCPVDCIHIKAVKPTLKTWKWHRPEGGYAAPSAS